MVCTTCKQPCRWQRLTPQPPALLSRYHTPAFASSNLAESQAQHPLPLAMAAGCTSSGASSAAATSGLLTASLPAAVHSQRTAFVTQAAACCEPCICEYSKTTWDTGCEVLAGNNGPDRAVQQACLKAQSKPALHCDSELRQWVSLANTSACLIIFRSQISTNSAWQGVWYSLWYSLSKVVQHCT